MTGSSIEGPVSRHLNRRLSRPLARLLAPTSVTPNQVSLGSLGTAAGALVALAVGQRTLGGGLIQASSVIDGVDGDLARLQGRATPFGAVYDALLDRYADAAMIGGITLQAARRRRNSPLPFVAGFSALTGALLVSYSRSQLEAQGFRSVLQGPALFASRDVRLLIAAAGSASGRPLATLAGLAALSFGVVAARLRAAALQEQDAAG